MVEVDIDPAVRLDEVDGVLEDREVREAEEVELQEAERLDRVHLVLGHQRIGVRGLLQGHELGQRLAADHDARGVGGSIPGHALELLREVDDLLHAGIGVVLLAQRRRAGESLVEPDPELVRDGFRDPVDLAVGMPEHAPDVADRGPGEHRPERDDLGHMVVAVLLGDVRDDLVTAVVLKVDVDVRHRHPIGVEEPLERELVEDRIDRGDPEGVGDDRTRGAPPAGRLDPALAREPDEVGHDEEVAGVAHREDDAELVVEPLLKGGRDRAVAPLQAVLALLPEPRFDRLAVGHREHRDPELPERELDVAHLGYPAGVQDRVGLVRKERRHLGRGLQVEVVGLELQPARRVEVRRRPDAQQHVVCRRLGPMNVVQVVRDDEGQAHLRCEPKELLVQSPLLGQAVILELEEEAVRPEDVAVLARDAPGEVPVLDLEGS